MKPEQDATRASNPFRNLTYDIPAGLVVFLVALPLCLGIALASDAPLYSGIIAGFVGGLVVPFFSRSPLGVSGPAAGLTAIVVLGVENLGSFELFLVATVIGGLIQVLLYFIQAGVFAYFLPGSVIKGMLAAIGLILILKQLPHALGYDYERFGLDKFFVNGGENTFTVLIDALCQVEYGALLISILCMSIIVLWEKTSLKKISWMPSALMVVIAGTFMNEAFKLWFPKLALGQSHLVSLPAVKGIEDFISHTTFPNFSGALFNPQVWFLGLMVGVIASLESLLTVEAVDKIDPYERNTPLNRELLAQGIANAVSGLLGGLPVTAVIVRSSASINAGGRSKAAAFAHGVFLIVSVMTISKWLNMIPLASLACILLVVGYKLTRPSLIVNKFRQGKKQFYPFIITVLAILFTDLLRGILIGIVVGVFFVLREQYVRAIRVNRDENEFQIVFNQDMSFINRYVLIDVLSRIPDGSNVIVDGTQADVIDKDIYETLKKFESRASAFGISVTYIGIEEQMNRHKEVQSRV